MNLTPMEGNMPRKNVESFAGNAQYGDRNKGLVDWKIIFQGERSKYASQNALKGTATQRKRPYAKEIDTEGLEDATTRWIAAQKAKKQKAEEEKDAAKAEGAAAEETGEGSANETPAQ
eukprot:TRINITY_DN15932_c0_g1_i1.p2 TRINITY_DN15932_c0_g1~~TRINITY_DN15932_c0_g1_i1.p2  ORF type:complete len:118 (+),score=28.90 TRINITY_DN15932_c0_g1_i1:230-583(+)